MKKLFLLFSLSLAALAGANAQTNNLVVYSEDGQKFYLILNGIKQNDKAQTNVKVTGLNQPTYKAKVIFEDTKIPDCNGNIQFMWAAEELKDAEMVWVVKKDKKGAYKLKAQSQTSIASAPKDPNQVVYVYTTTTPQPVNNTTTSTTTTTGTNTGTSTGVNIGVNADGTGFNMNVNVTDPTMTGTGTSTSTTTTTTTTTSSSTTVNGTTTGSSSSTTTTNGTGGNVNMNVNVNDGNWNPNTGNPQHGTDPVPNNNTGTYVMPGYTGPIGCAWPMSDADFASAKKSIESKSFEDSKMTLAKQVFNSNCMTSSQVKEIMMLFSFEASRLDFAKYAYGKTYDQGNYYKVNDAFQFESSIDELNEYIKKK